MKNSNISFEKLETMLLDKMEAGGCSPVTITMYRYLCNSIFFWLKENEYNSYSKEGGNNLLESYYSTNGYNQYYRNLRTVVYRLNDILDGTWKHVHSDKGKHFALSDEFVAIVENYCTWAADKGLAAGTIKNKRYTVSWFLDELSKLSCHSLEEITHRAVTIACTRISNHRIWGEIGVFLRYLTEMNLIDSDYSILVPHYSKPYILPSVYTIEEISLIEKMIDNSTVIGKRDYAMVLLASRMGMRSGDIVRLKISDIYNKESIDIIQEKTGKRLHLPVVEDARFAIEDYLFFRPSTPVEQLFISINAPYRKVTTATLRHALSMYISLAGVNPGMRKRGPHALRSSLASSMINNDIPYETVRKVLGHSSNNAIKHYARIDVEKLRNYCLVPPVPTGKFRTFLYGEAK